MKNSCIFWRSIFLEKLQLTSRAFKQAHENPKKKSFAPPNVLNKLMSRNPTLTRRCEVNKFNLVTFYKYQSCGSLITQFSRPRVATILSSFFLQFLLQVLVFFSFLYKKIIEDSSINSSFSSRFKFQDCKFKILVWFWLLLICMFLSFLENFTLLIIIMHTFIIYVLFSSNMSN